MVKVVVFLVNGFEEIEAIAAVDVLRRAGVEVTTASLGGRAVLGAHDIQVVADRLLDDIDSDTYDALVLPGGTSGSAALRDDPRVQRAVASANQAGKLVAAICAAPIALEAAGVLKGRRATSYPGCELPSADYQEESVVEDGNIITSRGPGTAIEFALTLVARLVGAETAARLRQSMVVFPSS